MRRVLTKSSDGRSSANWKKDQLKPDEMANYKRKLGLKKAAGGVS